MLLELGFLILVGIYLQCVCSQDKKNWKVMQEHNRIMKTVEKRRLREEKLKLVRVKHPKVTYLDDYRQFSPPQKAI